ncbi:hypothetical protein BJ944DRAFT_266793 [Cunninghamella echinulata]|nr:hypothetical protein BJ944DRAFT_266793 [Cunninghamella echinulata]
MDIWKDLCLRAFDGEQKANDAILYIEGCGQLKQDEYMVKLPQHHDNYETLHQTLVSLGFKEKAYEYTLPGEAWSSFIDIKRKSRMEWHAHLQIRLFKQLQEALGRIQEPLLLTSAQRLVLIQEFIRNHATDVGSVPFLRGLVGCLRFQLYKTQLVEWQVEDYILTQNGEEAILDYIRLIRGVLGLQLLDQDKLNNDSVAINIPIPSPSQSINKNDHQTTYLTWRMNANLSDQDLIDILDCLPRQQSTLGYSLSTNQRPTRALLPSSPLLRWLVIFIRRYLKFFRL